MFSNGDERAVSASDLSDPLTGLSVGLFDERVSQ
jgi:hypothetical protein